ncbi:FadR/GntR family transcriptional regulator [Halocynthiibacter sp. C4]|uniref:FadR/GntR family transcriptional regulator n=1 Tax=Halocynthiibacter sp. C4 TaxID=2992758 RepID=UPI00237B47FD|nr:FadR/GntR family transcriptional regulator [Halocynthiibacter sp. C4]MDE0591447.1 FadR/GntR family transcriptional regulator [Halocynthiibacter sp. C4]
MKKRSPLSRKSAIGGVIEVRGILGAAVENLGVRIVGGEWAEGDAISKEADLVEELGVSRSVVREAFRILGAKGLIRSKTSDGTRVMLRSEWRLLDPDVMDWRIQAGDTISLLDDLQKVRLVMEPGIAFTATQMATEEQRARVKAAWERKVAVAEEPEVDSAERRQNFIDADLDFHRSLIECVGSELLEQLYAVIEASMSISIDLQMAAVGYISEMVGMDESQQLHEAVYNAFMDGDAERACTAMREVIASAIRDMQDGLAQTTE